MKRSTRISLPAPLFALGLIALLFSLLVHAANTYYRLREGHASRDPGVPQFPITLRDVALTTSKSSRLGLQSSAEDMRHLLPPGDGFVYLPDRDEHYIVSHYHQLHCLRSLRAYFINRDQLDEGDIGHVDHCLIYLRQMVLCNVDLTLEPASHRQLTPDGRLTNAVTGVGITHRCKDWSQARQYMEENYEQWKDTYKVGMSHSANSTGSGHMH
ncbi:unnamed protein product [Somion occarium]|uniref:Oxidase ustYa n=1 Tax=Somion occarium TaxID=3059160 RepID=A0ABP1CNN6_9APHY